MSVDVDDLCITYGAEDVEVSCEREFCSNVALYRLTWDRGECDCRSLANKVCLMCKEYAMDYGPIFRHTMCQKVIGLVAVDSLR